jgi:hypothetical protein
VRKRPAKRLYRVLRMDLLDFRQKCIDGFRQSDSTWRCIPSLGGGRRRFGEIARAAPASEELV